MAAPEPWITCAASRNKGELVRARVSTPFPWARSAIVCMASYHSAQPRSTDPAPAATSWIARYAWSSRVDEKGQRRPSDYHKVLLKRLKKLESLLRRQCGAFESRAYVDTGPVVERALATAAGLGWTAKNTCLIHPRLGSYVFLGVLLTSLEVASGDSRLGHRSRPLRVVHALPRCVPHERSLRALPDGRDKVHLLSHHRTSRPDRTGIDEWDGTPGVRLRYLPGCVSVESQGASERGLRTCGPSGTRQPRAWSGWPRSISHDYEKAFNGSPVRRPGFNGLRRNLAIAMGNTGHQRFTARLRRWAAEPDKGLRAAAAWALDKLGMSEDQQEDLQGTRTGEAPSWPRQGGVPPVNN